MNITIDGVEKSYDTVAALDKVSFEIPAGSTFGVLGTNGAGKTTLFRLLVGHDIPDAGHLTIAGMDTVAAGDKIREIVGYLPEKVGYPGLLTGRELLELHGEVHQLTAATTRINTVLETVGLEAAAERRIAGYSNGMRRRLGLAAALIAEPPILILDEPTAGLDPLGVESFHKIIERINRETDATIVLSSHVLSEVERICDRVAILHQGGLCAVGSITDLAGETDAPTCITIQTCNPDARRSVGKLLAKYGSVTRGGEDLLLSCDRSKVIDLVGQLDPKEICGIEIEEPGLESVFHAAISEKIEGVTA